MALRPRLSTGVLLSDDNHVQLFGFAAFALSVRIPSKKAPITKYSRYLNEKKHKWNGGIPYCLLCRLERYITSFLLNEPNRSGKFQREPHRDRKEFIINIRFTSAYTISEQFPTSVGLQHRTISLFNMWAAYRLCGTL
jgi:hypothetical protein